jgi:hypothetical protein
LLGARSGWLLIWGRCSEERRTGKSACATERRRTLARERQELAIVLGRYGGTGRNACATETRGYYSVLRADILSRR